jgi:hypothetical protein
VTCPGCQRDNQPARRYCGGCGCNFEPACASCGFANDAIDRFCGGCGVALRAGDSRMIGTHAAAAPVAAGAVIAAPTGWASELADLFEPAAAAAAAVEESDLPEAGINQDDVDRLFGDAS